MKHLIKLELEIEAPPDATHFTGANVQSDVTWWKHQVNSTGVIRAWYWFSCAHNVWMYYGEFEPPFLKVAPWHSKEEDDA